jgi:hypothetical protein
MTRAVAVGRHVLVWLSRISLWIVVSTLAIGAIELAYFGAGNTSLFGCTSKVDTLFYFACNGGTTQVIVMFVFNLPVLFVYAVGSAALGFPPPGPAFAALFYVLDAIFVLAVLRLLYLLYAGARRLARGKPRQTDSES